jgi:adenylate cyclase
MPTRITRKAQGAAIALAMVGLITLGLSRAGVLAALDRVLLDARIRAFPAKVDPQVVIVDLDEQSLARRGEWPWRRGVHASLIRKLTGWGAKRIVFDMLFTAPSGRPQEDAALAAAIREAGPGRVALASLWSGVAVGKDGQPELQFDLPLPQFQAAHGLAAFSLDEDGTVRHSPPLEQQDEPVLALAALRTLSPESIEGCVKAWGSGGAVIPLPGKAGAYPTVSYANVLDGVLDPRVDPAFGTTGLRAPSYADLFRDRIVFVGASDVSLHDAFNTATTQGKGLTPGVELQASLFAALRRKNLVDVAPGQMDAGAAALLSLLAAVAMLRFRWRAGLAAGVGVATLYAGGGFIVFSGAHLAVGLALPLTALALTLVALLCVSIWDEEREKQHVRATFGRYVSPKVIERILKDPVRYRTAAAERRSVTVLFMDLAGFTGFAERSEPDLVQRVLNAYLREMTGCILGEDGILDKYVGDGIMAVWGSLGDGNPAEDARRAVRCAVVMQTRLAELNRGWLAEGMAELRARIGIHSGEALVGNFGSELRMDFTAVGDVVNTAARLEALNKEHGSAILVSGETARLAEPTPPPRDLGEAVIRGREGTLRLYAVEA